MALKHLHDMQHGIYLYYLPFVSVSKKKFPFFFPKSLMCIMNPGEKEWGGLRSDLVFDIYLFLFIYF